MYGFIFFSGLTTWQSRWRDRFDRRPTHPNQNDRFTHRTRDLTENGTTTLKMTLQTDELSRCTCSVERKRIIDNSTGGGLSDGVLWRRTWRSHWFKRALRIVYTADQAYSIVKWRLMCAPYNGTTVIFLQFFVRQIESFWFHKQCQKWRVIGRTLPVEQRRLLCVWIVSSAVTAAGLYAPREVEIWYVNEQVLWPGLIVRRRVSSASR